MPQGERENYIPPVVIKANPENFTINFKAEEIRIAFDEYVKLNNAQKQIIISPPMDPKAETYPLSSASKEVRIKITDTLLENTTYTINFGNSIQDNNEGNTLPFYKYVFSTGTYIDSLSVSGTIKDAYNNKTGEFVSIMLYEVDSTYNDSVVYNKLPTYISSTQDTLNSFSVDNMKAGVYKMVALLDKNQNYKFDASSDKIGFLDSLITIPSSKKYNMSIFQEVLSYKAERPKQLSKNHLIFGYQGNADSTKINVISETNPDFEYRIIKDRETDTLHYWYKPFMEVDSLVFEVTNQKYVDTVLTKIKDMNRDSLTVSAITKGIIDVTDPFKISANIPLTKLDTSFVNIINQDSIPLNFEYTFEERENTYSINFPKEEKQLFNIELLPGALTDFYNTTNDTLNFRVKTPDFADLGALALTVGNIKSYPVIVQLTNDKGELYKEIIHHEEDGNEFNFTYIKPTEYLIRVIYDNNDNGKWDTGNYLKGIQPEEIIYYPGKIEIRANWDVVEQFRLK